ncbi:MAG: hypothetical protein LBU65_05600 [Planctomycetaceae bacterium]|jgi:flagellin-like hook-associated protein FlgL|nr:hypothetical protein [Planctomycetaceae bacterium]
MSQITSSNFRTNISSLVGQLSYQRSDALFQTTVRNLSTGIKINSGKDGPSEFLASSMLTSEISATTQAVSNCERADSVISTADSALSQLSSLLNDVKGIVVEAANTGVETPTMIAALQLQLDSTLDTINRIAATTKFLGKTLLDGSLDFTTYGLDPALASQLTVNQANFLGRTEKDVSVKVLQTAKQAELYYPYGAATESIKLEVGGSNGYEVFEFDRGADISDIAQAVNASSDSTGVGARVEQRASNGSIALTSYGTNNDVILTASESGSLAGNFTVRYVVPDGGNDTLGLNYTPANGNAPAEIAVMLQTTTWQRALYSYNGENDGLANNEFTISPKIAGSGWNDVEFKINNVNETGGTTGVVYNLQSTPKTITLNVAYNPANPQAATNTTVNDVAAWFAADKTLATYFDVKNVEPSNGTGAIVPTSAFTLVQKGVDGGEVLTTAEQVVSLINNSPLLRDANGNGIVSAALPTGTTGLGTVSPFSEYSYYGDANDKNLLQFLAPANPPTIRFVSEPGTPLSIDDKTAAPIYSRSTAQIQGLDPNTSFTLKAHNTGSQYDGIAVIMQDAANESAVYDPAKNAVVISVDFAGRESDPSRGSFTMNDLQSLVASDPFVGSMFYVEPQTYYAPSNPPAFTNSAYVGMSAEVGEFSGGLVSAGEITIHLETDTKGLIKTTANDLVKFFDNPSTEESRAVLEKYGISVSSIDPSNYTQPACTQGLSEMGTGVLRPSYDPKNCTNDSNLLAAMYPQAEFAGNDTSIALDYPRATVRSKNGIDASFVVTAAQEGSRYNNTVVRVEAGAANGVRYDDSRGELVITTDRLNPLTADDVVRLINNTPEVSSLFRASRASGSAGDGIVADGDKAQLTGGVKASASLAETTVISSGGINAAFQVSAKRVDTGLENVEVRVMNDTDGPRVVYDSATRQLTVGVNPEQPMTANEVVELINQTSGVRDLFTAAIPTSIAGNPVTPNGNGIVQDGDKGTLRVSNVGVERGAPMLGAADNASLGLTFYALEAGSQSFVEVKAIGSSTFQVTDRNGTVVDRTSGVDAKALINNILAVSSGNVVSSMTSDLDVSIRLTDNAIEGTVFGFRITGGGALMQLGPDANPTQQARIALPNINVAKLGGYNGTLDDLRSGGVFALNADTNGAFRVVEEVTNQVNSLRGRLGSFQKYQVQATLDNLVDSIEIASGANSEIKDADFAAESSQLARVQLLMQATLTILPKITENSQALLGLLQR